MAILSAKPYVDADGFEYPLFAINIISRADFAQKKLAAPTVLNLHPYRVEADGTIIPAPASAIKSILLPDAYKAAETDPAVARVFGGTLQLLGEFIAAKGL